MHSLNECHNLRRICGHRSWIWASREVSARFERCIGLATTKIGGASNDNDLSSCRDSVARCKLHSVYYGKGVKGVAMGTATGGLGLRLRYFKFPRSSST